MAKVEEKAKKSRQTKLSKKSAEELIQIILRKDEVERKQSAQIANLKSEVNSLSSRIEACYKDQEGTDKAMEELKYSYNNAMSELQSKASDLEDETEAKNAWSKDYFALKDKYNHLKNICFAAFGVILILLIGFIFY